MSRLRDRGEREMSEHESGSEAIATYSSNGKDPSGSAGTGDYDPAGHADDGATFLSDLARAMQSTAAAEQARNAEGTEQRRQAHIDAIRAREAMEAEDLRELAKEDVKGIDAWSDGEIKRVKLERERRIASRREQLQIRLEEHRNVVAREVEAVEAAVAAYRSDIEAYFQRLGSETDPVAIARHAGTRPPFPVLELIGAGDAPATSRYSPISRPVVTAPVAPIEEPASTDDDSPSGSGDAGPTDAEAETPVIAASTDVVEAEAATADVAHAEAQAEPAQAEPAEAEPAMAEAIVGDGGPTDNTTLIGVMAPEAGTQETANPWQGSAEAAGDQASTTEPAASTEAVATADDASTEPVAAVAEARVVMPKTTGAGSWLRWPSSSADRSDPSH